MRKVALVVLTLLMTATPPVPVEAAFPGDAGRLAFVLTTFDASDPVSIERDIYTVRIDGSDLQQLTATAEWEALVRWAPHGDRIAYVAGDDHTTTVVTMPAEGGDPDVVSSVLAPGHIHGIAWSPDGASLAVLTEVKAGFADITIVQVDGSSTTALTSLTGTSFGRIDWSPDGRHLATSRSEAGAFPEIVLVPLDGGPIETLGAGAGPSWSPDGSSMVFLGEAGTSIIRSDGSDLHTIPGLEYSEPPSPGLGVGYYPVWSPAGDDIAIISFQGVSIDIVDPVTGDRTTALYPLDGTVGMVDWQPIPYPGGFFDVPPEHLFAEDIAWLADEGITKGCNPPLNTLFCPARALSRAEAAALLVRALDLPPALGDNDLFVDDDATVFESDIEALAHAGISHGCNPPQNDRFCPDNDLSRGEAAALLTRALDLPPAAGDDDQFNDAVGSVFQEDIAAFAASHITRGCNPPANTLFCPDRPLTRAETAALLHRAAVLGWRP